MPIVTTSTPSDAPAVPAGRQVRQRDWREDCSRRSNCVKLRCLYDVYRQESAYNRDPMTPLEPLDGCKACLSCVQGCTKGLLNVS